MMQLKKMIFLGEAKEIPDKAEFIGTVEFVCNGCGKTTHTLFREKNRFYVSCQKCKLKWEVSFMDATGTA